MSTALTAPSQDPPAQDPTTRSQPSSDLTKELDELRRRIAELERDRTTKAEQLETLELEIDGLQSRATEPASGDAQQMMSLGQGNLLNPRITVFGDFVGNLSTDSANNAYNRLSLRELEVDLRAAIAPWVDGVAILSVINEVDQTPSGGTEIFFALEVEEAYANFHTLPFDLALKAGVFRSAFGRQNRLHTHDIPQITRPLVTQAYFGADGISSVGLSLAWLVPNPWNKYVEFRTELVNADSYDEAPIFGGPDSTNPAVVSHLKWFETLSDAIDLEIGGSYLYTATSESRQYDAQLFGADLTLQWRDPAASDRHSVMLQAEAMWGSNDIDDPAGAITNYNFGTYAFVQYQFARDWYTGVRGDYTDFPNDEVRGGDDFDWAVSPYLTWYITEFIRLRAQYEHRGFSTPSGAGGEDNFYLNLTFAFGAHPAHPYWVNR